MFPNKLAWRKSMLKTISIALSVLFPIYSSFVHAESHREFSEQEIATLPHNTQKLIKYNRHLIDDLEYSGIKTIGFNESKKKASLTAVIKSKNDTNYPIYSTVISDDTGTPSLFFRNYIKCTPRNSNKITEKSIYIDGQKISANYMCVAGERPTDSTTEIYLIKTNAGKNFAHDAFLKNMYVFVKFDDFEVPFDTSGFSELWREASEPAL